MVRRKEHDLAFGVACEDAYERKKQTGAGIQTTGLDDELDAGIRGELRPGDRLPVHRHHVQDAVERGQRRGPLDRRLEQ